MVYDPSQEPAAGRHRIYVTPWDGPSSPTGAECLKAVPLTILLIRRLRNLERADMPA
jgi:hypothetical protein